jgi:hypothetical protein
MMLWVTIPPPPTSKVAMLVEPLEAEVVVAVPMPDEPVLELELEVDVSSAYKLDAVI